MSAHPRQLVATVGAGSAVVATLIGAPSASAAPMPSNCLPGTTGQTIYCDEDVNADGSWVRCSRMAPEPLTVFGGMAGPIQQGPPECALVTSASIPLGSPPYHIGYGGEATGRV